MDLDIQCYEVLCTKSGSSVDPQKILEQKNSNFMCGNKNYAEIFRKRFCLSHPSIFYNLGKLTGILREVAFLIDQKFLR